MKKKPGYMKVKPDAIKRGMLFEHLGRFWEVTDVRPSELSKAFYSRVWVCPAGSADCKMKLDIQLAAYLKWMRPIAQPDSPGLADLKRRVLGKRKAKKPVRGSK